MIAATHEVFFNDGSVEAVSGSLPPIKITNRIVGDDVEEEEGIGDGKWWDCVLLHVNEETKQYVSFGQISVNLDNVLFIKKL